MHLKGVGRVVFYVVRSVVQSHTKDVDPIIERVAWPASGKYVGNRPIKLRKSTWDKRNAVPEWKKKKLAKAMEKARNAQ